MAGSARDHSDEEFEAFFREHYLPTVSAMALIVGEVGEAKDYAQEAFIETYRRWSRVRTLDNPGAWVRKVAANRALSDVRKAARRRRIRDRLLPEVTAVPGPEPPAPLVTALSNLPEGQRIALFLYYFGDLSIGDVAHYLGISPGTVKSQLHDARRHLADLMEENTDAGTR